MPEATQFLADLHCKMSVGRECWPDGLLVQAVVT